jgi:hypothetical protein
MVAVLPSVGTVEARKIIEPAFIALTPADQALLHALFAEGKTISEVAGENGLRRTTLDSRVQRILDLLYAAIQATIASLILLVPKKARAFVKHATQRAPRVLVQATQFSSAMTMTVVCGALMPTGSSVTTEPSTLAGLTPYSTPQTTMAQVAGLEPSILPEVEPEEPKGLDAETNECSAADMKSTKFAISLQETTLSLALVVAPALTQVACAGTQQQTPPPQQPVEEPDGSPDPYDVMCDQERARGNDCITKEAWYKEFSHPPQ